MSDNFCINPIVAQPEQNLLNAFMEVPTSLVSDNLRRLEGIVGLRRIHRNRKLLGTAVTVKLRAGDNLLTYKALSMMTAPGYVMVGKPSISHALARSDAPGMRSAIYTAPMSMFQGSSAS